MCDILSTTVEYVLMRLVGGVVPVVQAVVRQVPVRQ
jgi:hypothetical protein